MSDLLGEALARWEGWQMGDPYDPGTLDQLLAAARNWHTLTKGVVPAEAIQQAALALGQLALDDPDDELTMEDLVVVGFHVLVDALTVTAE